MELERSLAAVWGDAFEADYRAHYRDVYRYALVMTRSREEAEDVTAATFERAASAYRGGRGPDGAPLPWLLLVARRHITDRWRRRRLLAWLPLVPGRGNDVSTDRPLERAEFWLWFDQLSSVLPARQREVLFLRYQRDLSDEDIGRVMGLTASGVRSLASRALSALRAHPELWS